MTCADFEILLCDYVDGTLESERSAAAEKHLAGCATCARLARDIGTAVAFTKEAPPVEPPDELITGILYHVPAAKTHRQAGWFRGLFTGWLEPVLQPRFAMGMAMTILSFSLVAKFTGIPERQLSPADLHPAKVVAAIDDRYHKVVDSVVKYVESLQAVFEIQSRLAEWSEEDEAVSEDVSPAEAELTPPGSQPDGGEGERSVAE